MKKIVFNSGILILLLLAGSISLSAKEKSIFVKHFDKKIEKSFNWEVGQRIDLDSRYGHIDVASWDQDRVEIVVTIKVEAKSEKKAQATMDRINILFSENSEAVFAKSEVESVSSWSWWGDSNDKFSINYSVKMPSKASLSIEHRYGDIYVAGVTGRHDIELKYGNLKLQDDIEEMDLEVGYGDVILQSVQHLDLEIKYSDLQMLHAEKIDIESKYSDFVIGDAGELSIEAGYDEYQIGKIGTLDYEGKYDDIKIEEVASMDVESGYTTIIVEKLHHFADVELTYGDFIVHNVSPKFRKIDIEGAYVDVKLGTQGIDDFDITVEGAHSDWSWPNGLVKVDEDKSGSYDMEGYFGGSGKGGKIDVELAYGSLAIK